MRRVALASLLLLPLVPARAQAGREAFASHPYMGWSSWSFYRKLPSEAAILAQADALIAAGLPALGYRYVNVDDFWSSGWDEKGFPKPDPARFPSGIDGLARALHSRGLLLGIYLNPGVRIEAYNANPIVPGTKVRLQDIVDATRAGSTRGTLNPADRPHALRIDFSKPGAAAFMDAQVAQLDRWGVDFLKLDFVGPGGGKGQADSREELRQWHRALSHASHPIWLELSSHLSIDQAALWKATSNGWRIGDDVECYHCSGNPSVTPGNLTEWANVVQRFAEVRPWIPYAGPGGWNDLDSLELGNGDRDGLTPAERQSMFTLWAVCCAPLYLGSDLTRMDPADLALISNRDVIAIDQAGVPASPVDVPSWRKKPNQQLWFTGYPDGSAVLAVFNLGADAAAIQLSLEELDSLRNTHFSGGPAPVFRDVYNGQSLTAAAGMLQLRLDTHACALLRFTPPN